MYTIIVIAEKLIECPIEWINFPYPQLRQLLEMAETIITKQLEPYAWISLNGCIYRFDGSHRIVLESELPLPPQFIDLEPEPSEEQPDEEANDARPSEEQLDEEENDARPSEEQLDEEENDAEPSEE